MNKVFNKIMIIDGSYMMHRNLKIPELWDLRNGSGNRSGGIFGFLRSLNFAVKTNEFFPIICWDSKLSNRRLEVYPNYKNNLEKQKSFRVSDLAKALANGESVTDNYSDDEILLAKEKMNEIMNNKRMFGSSDNPDDYLYQYRTQRDEVISICNSIGIPSLKFKGWEGDDIMVLLSRMAMRSIIVTDDKDLLQLLSPTTDVNRIKQGEYVTYDSYLKDNKLISIREMIIHKAISGDPSDSIPGVTSSESERKYCVGSTTAWKIARVIIENNEDPDKYIPALRELPKDKNKIEGFIRNHDNYLRNMKLVDLSLVENDPTIIDNIITEVRRSLGRSNFLETVSKLGAQSIVSFDVNSMISKVIFSSNNCML